jgi:predicted GNAT superfamily acetyltransferase
MEIRKLATPEEYLQAELLQKTVWHFPDREIVPLNELVVLQKHGGHVFGAFQGDQMVAFCFGCPAYREGKTYHYSRMLGVLPGSQDSGIGHRMKLRQREYVLEQGLDLIVWTFDPLQSRNAYLNIEKLGCVIRDYTPNLYPQSDSQFNRGLESDRFTPEWWIRSRRVKDRISGQRQAYALEEYAPALKTRLNKEGWRVGTPVRAGPREKKLSVEIPEDIDALKKQDLKLAQGWRHQTREAFQSLFGRGYVIHGFVTTPEPKGRRSFYLLEKGFRAR